MRTYALTVDRDNNNLRLDIFLARTLPDVPSRTFIKRIIDAGAVRVNGNVVKAHLKVCAGDRIAVDIPENHVASVCPEDIPLSIVAEDSDILIINKPSGMLAHPTTGCATGTLVNALLHRYTSLSDVNEPHRPGIVHRLDRETSGVMVVAKNNVSHARLARQFERHIVKKRYIALVEGSLDFDEGVIDTDIDRHPRHYEKKAVVYYEAKKAVTYYRVLRRFDTRSLVALFPRTGRTHQLRVHMAHLGHPILGDEKYGKKDTCSRLALHAQSIGFAHPRTKMYVEFSVPLPKELTDTLHRRS